MPCKFKHGVHHEGGLLGKLVSLLVHPSECLGERLLAGVGGSDAVRIVGF